MPTPSWPRASRLRIVLEHLEAVREIDSFLRGDECAAEIKNLQRIVDQEISRAVFQPADWTMPVWVQGDMFSGPRRAKWRVCTGRDNSVSVVIGIPRPVDTNREDNPFVGLYAPKQWKGLGRFTALLQANLPKGFDHIANHPNEGFLIDYPIWKYFPYGGYILGRSEFDLPAFLKDLTDAAKSMVAMEKLIEGLLVRMNGK